MKKIGGRTVFRTVELWARYHRAEGFRVGTATCMQCGHSWRAALFPETDINGLECPVRMCGAQNNLFEEQG